MAYTEQHYFSIPSERRVPLPPDQTLYAFALRVWCVNTEQKFVFEVFFM